MPDLITRQEALSRGLPRFYTGVPCPHGHDCERMTSNGHCRMCRKASFEAWRRQNPERMSAYVRESQKKRWHHDKDIMLAKRRQRVADNPGFRARINLSARIRAAFDGRAKTAATMALIGCSIEELRLHIESLWLPGMSWDNYGLYGWHIDHIKPCAAFDLLDPEQQRQCFHYTNLQPLWAEDNLRKGAR
jgi:hypothetical protein